MRWIHQFQLILFDFDGLLVNTEHLHWHAYIHMCLARGFELRWNFEQFCRAAHFDAKGLREGIYAELPALYAEEPRWEVLYAEKKQAFIDLLKNKEVEWMPGAESLLKAILEANIKHCVVTHSPQEFIDLIKSALPLLERIPTWITREQYSSPKPDPECYLKATRQLASPSDRIVGFEDSLRGLTALQATRAKPVLICPASHPQMKDLSHLTFSHFTSLEVVDFD